MNAYTNTLLLIDDEPDFSNVVTNFLSSHNFVCKSAANGNEALQTLIDDPTIDIILSVLSMPDMNGLKLVSELKTISIRELDYALFAGAQRRDHVIEAMKLNAKEFENKPVDFKVLLNAIKFLEEREFIVQTSGANALQHGQIREYFSKHQEENFKAHTVFLETLLKVSDYKDPETYEHCQRVGAYAEAIAKEMSLSEIESSMIRFAAPLHDIGKVGIPDHILLKPGKLTNEEFDIIRSHAEKGYSILSNFNHPIFSMAANIAVGHHEKWDGSGYPYGLSGTDIPLEARIGTVADIYDALRSDRPYRTGLTHEEASRVIINGDGRTSPDHFDPEVLLAFKSLGDKFEEIFNSFSDSIYEFEIS